VRFFRCGGGESGKGLPVGGKSIAGFLAALPVAGERS